MPIVYRVEGAQLCFLYYTGHAKKGTCCIIENPNMRWILNARSTLLNPIPVFEGQPESMLNGDDDAPSRIGGEIREESDPWGGAWVLSKASIEEYEKIKKDMSN